MADEKILCIVNPALTELDTALLVERQLILVSIDLSHTSITKLPSIGVMPNVQSLKLPPGCRVKLEDYPALRLLNGTALI